MVYLPLATVKSKQSQIEKFSSHKEYVIHDIKKEWITKKKDHLAVERMSKKIFNRLDDLYFGGNLHETTTIMAPRAYPGPSGTGSTIKTLVELDDEGKEVVKNEIFVKWDEFGVFVCEDVLEFLVGSILHEMVHAHWYVNRPLDKKSHDQEPYSVEFYQDIWHINQKLKISEEAALDDYKGPKSALEKRFPLPLRIAPSRIAKVRSQYKSL